MPDPQAALRNFPKEHEYLLAIDSDGCAFDSMEIKHKECFIPATIQHWRLQPVARYARAAAEFVNLYSKWRGTNRFPALVRTLDLLREWGEVKRRHADIPAAQPLRDWIGRETRLGEPALRAEVQRTGNRELAQALAWSEAVNAAIAALVHGVPPFPLVRETLEQASQWADILVCSATPGNALAREWREHDLAKYATAIAGQEAGSKSEQIALAAQGRYAGAQTLMVGDAPGDFEAARGNGARFFPIEPGREEQSWERFYCEAARRFRNGQYTAEYESGLVAEFEALLPEQPPWQN